MNDTLAETKVQCPRCNGRGVQGCLADWKDERSPYGMSGGWVEMKCDFCAGEGYVSPAFLAMREDWKRRGTACREKRLALPRETHGWHRIADALGIGVAPVSQMEAGSLDPAPLEEFWAKLEPAKT